LLGKVRDLQAATVRQAAARQYLTTPAALRKTLTLHNGKVAEHRQFAEEAGLKVYFAKPCSARRRGTNENTNGLVCQFFPKGMDLASMSEDRCH
jgi:IS30 family transposase